MKNKCNNIKDRISFFIERSIRKHNNYYDYSKVFYLNNRTKVEIICPIHGSFFQLPESHLKCGCKNCGNSRGKKLRIVNYNIFLEKANKIHNNKYEYIKETYKGTAFKINIICPEHGKFSQRARGYRASGAKCPECDLFIRSNEQKLTQEEAIQRLINIHGDRFDYSKVVYTMFNRKIKIICKKHGEFDQCYGIHLGGFGCKKCSTSIGESRIIKYLNEFNIKFEYEYRFNECRNIKPLKFDFYLTDLDVCIEFDGIQHYKSINYFGGDRMLEYMQKCDNIKNKYCLDNNIRLIRIPYTELDKIEEILSESLN